MWANTILGVMWFWEGATWEAIGKMGRQQDQVKDKDKDTDKDTNKDK